jgi:hypothetical protein
MIKGTRHFDIPDWVDYVRKQVTPMQSEEMQAHLSSGCQKCKKVAEQLSKFAQICSGENAFTVPEHVERSVKAFFALNRQPQSSLLQRIVGSLLYDSVNDPQPAGVRTGHQINRHVLYQAGDYSVDLRFEHEKGSSSMVLVGQIANRITPEELMAHYPVILFSGQRELTRSLSNSYGEFQLEYTPEPDMHLRVPIETRGQQLEVLLNAREF